MTTRTRTPPPTTESPRTLSSLAVDEAGGCDDASLRPYRHLAVRVLARALLDLANPAGSPTDRESARMFLAGSGMLLHWCRVAAVDPSCVVKHAERLARSGGSTHSFL